MALGPDLDQDAEHLRDEERRGMERCVYELEQKVARMMTTLAVTDAHVTGLISTMDSRHKAFERGQDLILEKLKPLDVLREQRLNERVTDLENLKNKIAGAVITIQILGITGIVGGIVAIVKLLRG